MSERTLYIVWNPERNEGFITDDKEDAEAVAFGGNPIPVVGDALREVYGDDEGFEIEQITVGGSDEK